MDTDCFRSAAKRLLCDAHRAPLLSESCKLARPQPPPAQRRVWIQGLFSSRARSRSLRPRHSTWSRIYLEAADKRHVDWCRQHRPRVTRETVAASPSLVAKSRPRYLLLAHAHVVTCGHGISSSRRQETRGLVPSTPATRDDGGKDRSETSPKATPFLSLK